METEFTASIEIEAVKAKNISEFVGAWWKEVSKSSGTPASPGKLYAVGNYLLELTKNSLGDGKSNGKVTATFDGEKIKILIEDFGAEEKEINLNVNGSYGMKEAIEYADDFVVEAQGRAWEKNKYNQLEEFDQSDIRKGSRVIFIKYNAAPPAEEAEEKFRGRDFNSRM